MLRRTLLLVTFLCLVMFAVGLVVQTPAAHSQADAPQSANAAPDLVIDSMTIDPASASTGQAVTVTVVVKNKGDAPTANAFHLAIYVEPVDDPPTATTPDTVHTTYGLPLPVNGTFTFRTSDRILTTSTPKIYAWVDKENLVSESDETNNLLQKTLSSGGSDDAYEEDDTCPTARDITTDSVEQEHNLNRNPGADADWVKFTAVSGVTYFAEAVAVGADADLTIELHSTCDGAPSFGNGAKIEFTAPANGVYYLKVVHNQNEYGPNTAYKLKIGTDSGCSNAYEPNDTCALSGDLVLGTAQSHAFCRAGDVDWMHFPVDAGAKYKVTTTNTGGKADVQMSIFMTCSNINSTASGSEVEFTAPAAGAVYIKTENKQATQQGAGTEYTLKAERLSNNTCAEDSAEQDDNRTDAHALTVDATPQTHNICPAADEDWVKFDATSGAKYTIETLELAKSSDTTICLYDGNDNKLACDDDGGPGRGSRITWTATANGTYFVRVADQNPAVAGPDTQYQLRIFTGLCKSDAFENDNARANAKSITPNSGGQTNRDFCATDDEDWAAFTASAGAAYIVETLNVGPEADTVLELYDANGKQLAQNDDHGPGAASQVAYTINTAGTYYVKVHSYNPARIGAGTEYTLSVRTGTLTPTPTPTTNVVPTPTPTPTPQASGAHTVIMVNRASLAKLYSEAEADQVLSKLTTLAQNDQVKGDIIRLDNNTAVSAAYATWEADLTNVEKANQVAAAIRAVIMAYVQQHNGIEYLVLVGDDRALPFRRLADNTDKSPEKTYKSVDATNPTGAALKANYFLTDDYYADREPTILDGREIYIPDLAVGRLIETPAEIQGMIDSFLTNPNTTVDNVLISGYDFVEDVATNDCQDWKTDLGAGKVDCSLIGNNWSAQGLRNLQLRTSAPFKIQSISGHAAHYAEGAPDGGSLQGHEVVASSLDLSGGLIYTPGCHAGLNVPPTNSTAPIDLPQAFLSKHTNYVGNTGYGWGLRSALGLSEKVIRLYTQQLLAGASSKMGKALIVAKGQYFQQQQSNNFNPFDEKVMQQLVFYGLPMQQLLTGAALGGPEDPFPGVDFKPTLPAGSLGDETVITGSVHINAAQALGNSDNFQLVNTENGSYYALNGSNSDAPGQPVQPLHFGDVSVPTIPARGVLLRSAEYTTKQNFEPLVAAPYNEFYTATLSTGEALSDPLAWYPPVMADVQANNNQSTLVTQIGQYNPATKQLRIYDGFDFEVLYSLSTDQAPPEVLLIDSIYHADTGLVDVKVDAQDSSGIQKVIVSLVKESSSTGTQVQSINLTFDASAHKWIGSFSGDLTTTFFVQVADAAGNVRTETNKGRYYAPTLTLTPSTASHKLYLSVVKR